jgi:DNA transposition AAA+ family ATPase
MSETRESHAVDAGFVETLEYRRFVEFCEACRRYCYIGLCYGPPGVGKTLSARHYSRWQTIQAVDLYNTPEDEMLNLALTGKLDTVLYTASVINTPRSVARDISLARSLLHWIAREPVKQEHRAVFEQRQRQYDQELEEYSTRGGWLNLYDPPTTPPDRPPYSELAQEFVRREKATADPTSLVLIDEADRLKMASLEATRDIFDQSQLGLILIGMPGIEKRLARYPQFYSRIGFVHEYRRLSASELRQLLEQAWTPPGVRLPPMDEEAIAAVVRITGGNFRLLDRLLAQTERILEINQMSKVTRQAVEAARTSLVIGQTG